MNNNQHEVFISYSTKDSNIANHLVDLIEAKGIKCWLAERDIPAGTPNWEQPITEAIHSAKVFVVIISKNSVDSTQVPREIRLAVNFCEAIYPIRIDNVELKGSFEYYLSGYQWTDVTLEQREKLEKFSDIVWRFLRGNTGEQNKQTTESDISKDLMSNADKQMKFSNRIYVVIAVTVLMIVGGILFGVMSSRGGRTAEINQEDSLSVHQENAVDGNHNVEDTEGDSTDALNVKAQENDNTAEQVVSNVPESVPSQKESTENMYSKLGSIYEEMLNETTQPVDMTQYLTNIVNTDIDNDGIEDAFLFTKSEEGYDGAVEIQLSSGATLSWDDVAKQTPDDWIPSAGSISPVDICAVDMDGDGICEVLLKQAFGGTGGILCTGYIYKYSEGAWDILPIRLDEDIYDKTTDIQLIKDGIVVLMDYGMKDGPFQYRDYKGIKCAINGSYIQQIEKTKAIAKEYWPLEEWSMDSSNYEEHDFTVTDEVIAQLKEELDIPSDVYVTVSVSGVLYYERRDVYLKRILFEGDGIYSCVYVDKYNNQIDFNMY